MCGALTENQIIRQKTPTGAKELTNDVCLISILFRIVSSLNHIDLPLFMINNVNVTLLRQFLNWIVYPSLL